MKRLFLTGEMGCGKSTAIEKALGANMARCAGFRTRRTIGPDGHAISFYLESPDGSKKETFLDFSSGKPEIRMDVFARTAPALMQGKVLLLDEIGGLELLCPEFTQALESVLAADVPILGVMKGPGPASALIRALGLTEEYQLAADTLRQRLDQDPDTLLYECSQFDEKALMLARQWAGEYLHE